MRFASLGSGSSGNATLVQSGHTSILVDCGFTLKETRRRLSLLDTRLEQIDAILVSHEHGDHVAGVKAVARAAGASVWMTAGTRQAGEKFLGSIDDLNLFSSHTSFGVGELFIEPFPVPHDAREPSQFVIGDGERRLGVLTDAGHATDRMREQLTNCDALMLEFNHCRDMLLAGPYPPALIERIDSDYGHLNNAQAGRLLSDVSGARLTHLVALHISRKNNGTDRVRAAINEIGAINPENVRISEQMQPTPWLILD